MNGITRDQNQKIDIVDKRIDNLVLHSGGDSPNEVVDARVNNRAQQFDTLQGRLLAGEFTHDEDMAETRSELENQNVSISEINKSLIKYSANMEVHLLSMFQRSEATIVQRMGRKRYRLRHSKPP